MLGIVEDWLLHDNHWNPNATITTGTAVQILEGHLMV
jgi:hypothetical protein